MVSHQQYSPISPIDDNFHHDSEHTSQDSRESVELTNVQHQGQPAAPPAQQSKKGLPPPYSKVFNSNQQTWKLLFPQFFRWLGTVAFIAFILATLKMFENRGNFSNTSKHLFNTIVTALSLGLGLNFFVSLTVHFLIRYTHAGLFRIRKP